MTTYKDYLAAAEANIKQNIRPGGVKTITATVLQDVLTETTNLTESAITSAIESAVTTVGDIVFDGDNLADGSISSSKLANGSVTTEKIAVSGVTTAKLNDGSVTEPKLASAAVTTIKIKNQNVTREKLAEEVTDKLLTEEMKEYIELKLREQLLEEAQSKFVGTTTNGGTKTFYYGETSAANAKKIVSVNIKFDGTTVKATDYPEGWLEKTSTYEYTLGGTMADDSVASSTFSYTIPDGKYSGLTVTYKNSAAATKWVRPAFYGFTQSNTPSSINISVLTGLDYTKTNYNKTESFTNTSSSERYFCVVASSASTVSVTQLGGISVMDEKQALGSIQSPYGERTTMSGYVVYFSKNTVKSGMSIDNATISITL